MRTIKDKAYIAIAAVWALGVIGSLAITAGAIAVVIHFTLKFW